MPTLTVSDIQDLIRKRLQIDVSVDRAFTDADELAHINDAYADVWEISGGALKRIVGGSLWTPQPSTSTDSIFESVLTDVGEIKEVFHSVNSGSTGDIVSGDTLLEPVDQSEILYMRSVQALFGKYAVPKLYSVTRNYSTSSADVNKLRLDVWPGVAGYYLPTHYIPQFTPLDAVSVTVPSVNDLESRDIYLLAAARMAPLTGRAELVPGILADISQRTTAALERKFSALIDARADR